jgi:hypothetical protein
MSTFLFDLIANPNDWPNLKSRVSYASTLLHLVSSVGRRGWKPGLPQPLLSLLCLLSLFVLFLCRSVGFDQGGSIRSVEFDQYIDWGSDSCSFDPIYTSHHPSSIDHHLPSFRELVCEASSLDKLNSPCATTIRRPEQCQPSGSISTTPMTPTPTPTPIAGSTSPT